MYTPCSRLPIPFFVNVSRKGTELFISGSSHDSSLLPQSFRQPSWCRNVNQLPSIAKFRGLSVLLLLCGDISLNPGAISFGVVNLLETRDPVLQTLCFTHSLKLLAMTKTHICATGNHHLLCSITLLGFKLCHRPHD